MKEKGKFIPNKKNKILTLAGILLSCFGTVKAKPESGRDGHLLEQIRSVSRQKGELQQQEVELRARMLAMEIQRSFESRSAQYENVAARLQAWANESLLREQNKEVATLRSERDHFEAERSQNIHKISELEEYFQEKERQYAAFHEQDRIAQETSKYKDEQLREAQGWMARAQEMDAFQSSTNHSLQAELRERTEQYNQLWHGCQRQKRDVDLLRHGVPSSGSDEPSALICHASTRDYSGGFTSSCTVSVTAAKGVKTKNPSFVGRMLQASSDMAKQNHVSAYGLSVPCSN
ncbi:BnaC09g53150D [Brassica napus]|uniref:BnaC09g53150D protein n=1 Tax=Brassica napus TaxID=3708 RepID=A0A078JI70_BRANA|nr:BnaC09g53150D [Brassica napus]